MDNKLTNVLIATLIVLSCTMLICTLNYISSTTNNNNIQTTISAFSA